MDRDNVAVADWYQTLHPAVIRAILTVLKGAQAANKAVIICGEIAASTFYTPLLIGLGRPGIQHEREIDTKGPPAY